MGEIVAIWFKLIPQETPVWKIIGLFVFPVIGAAIMYWIMVKLSYRKDGSVKQFWED